MTGREYPAKARQRLAYFESLTVQTLRPGGQGQGQGHGQGVIIGIVSGYIRKITNISKAHIFLFLFEKEKNS